MPATCASILTALEQGDVLFIDEIHRLSRVVEEAALLRDGRLRPRSHHRQRPLRAQRAATAARPSPSSAPPPASARWPRPCATASARSSGCEYYDESALQRIIRRSARILQASDGRGGEEESPAARAARRVSPTVCCAACATMPRCAPTASSREQWPRRRLNALEVDERGLRPYRPHAAARHHPEVRWRPGRHGDVGRQHQRGDGDHRRRARSRICCSSASWHARRAAASPRAWRTSTSASPTGDPSTLGLWDAPADASE